MIFDSIKTIVDADMIDFTDTKQKVISSKNRLIKENDILELSTGTELVPIDSESCICNDYIFIMNKSSGETWKFWNYTDEDLLGLRDENKNWKSELTKKKSLSNSYYLPFSSLKQFKSLIKTETVK